MDIHWICVLYKNKPENLLSILLANSLKIYVFEGLGTNSSWEWSREVGHLLIFFILESGLIKQQKQHFFHFDIRCKWSQVLYRRIAFSGKLRKGRAPPRLNGSNNRSIKTSTYWLRSQGIRQVGGKDLQMLVSSGNLSLFLFRCEWFSSIFK